MKTLLHVCCTDCLLNYLSQFDNVELDLLFYNPNIHPRTEYLERLNALKKIIETKKYKLIVCDWSPKEYYSVLKTKDVKDLINNKNIRCPSCWFLRLNTTAQYAIKYKYDSFSSTLLTSHYQERDTIVEIGKNIAKIYNLRFIDNIKHNCDLKTGGFYKQNYCGCAFSLLERYEEKFLIP